MKFRKIGLKGMLSLTAVAALVVVIPYFYCLVVHTINRGHPILPKALYVLQGLMFDDACLESRNAGGFQLVEGDALALERWLARKYDELVSDEQFPIDESRDLFTRWLARAEAVVKRGSSGEFRLEDVWGQRLVYRCPHPDPAYVCQLYSIGPNGIDEGGKGDDMEEALSYKSISYWFEDRNFDGNVYRKFRGQLTKVTLLSGHSMIRHP